MSRQRVGVPIGAAADALGLSVDAVRKRIKRRTLEAYKEDDRWLVVLDAVLPGVQDAPSTPAGRPVQDATGPGATGGSDNIMPSPASVAVSPSARAQLEAIRDEWLAPLVAQITDQAERIGRLEAERDQLRAEVEALRSQASPAPPHEAATPSAPAATPAAEQPAGGLMRWVRRVLLGEE